MTLIAETERAARKYFFMIEEFDGGVVQILVIRFRATEIFHQARPLHLDFTQSDATLLEGQMTRKHHGDKNENARHARPVDENAGHESASRENNQNENPPRTTSHGWLTTPKFGASTSGGGEIDPGPERD